jgi:heme o synthase
MSAIGEAKHSSVAELAPLADSGTFFDDCMMLVKPRLSALVLLSTAAGFYLGSRGFMDLALLGDVLIGTAVVATGSSMLNQVLERKSDALMERTRNRPLATGRMTSGPVLYAGTLFSIFGLLFLALRVNLDSSLLAAATLGLYVFVYTPMKRMTTLNTLVGAIPGALPPLIGWAAVGELNAAAWALFGILFIWQLPHFLAIAWIYRADYAKAGLMMLPTVDTEGYSTGRQIVVHSMLLLPTSLLPFLFHVSSGIYFIGAAVLGLGFLYFGLNFAFRRTDWAAKQLFLASVIYLPLLLTLMVLTKF